MGSIKMKLVINDPTSGKSYSTESDAASLAGRKIGDTVPGNLFNLPGYELKITGGSDEAGFPLHPSVPGSVRKRILIGRGFGCKEADKGIVLRKTFSGNTITPKTSQLNLLVTKQGTKSLAEIFPKKESADQPQSK